MPSLYDGPASSPTKGFSFSLFSFREFPFVNFSLLVLNDSSFNSSIYQQTRENFNTTREEAESLMRKMLEVRKTVIASRSAFLPNLF